MTDMASTLTEMPFFGVSTSELVNDLLFNSESVYNSALENRDFHQWLTSRSNNDILRQLDFAYVTEDKFNHSIADIADNIDISVFHMNIRSLNKNHTSLYAYLMSLDIHFDVLVLSEIWNYNLEFYQNVFHGYTFHYVAPKGTNVGGVGVYVKDVFDCTVLDDLHIASDKSSVNCKRRKFMVKNNKWS